MIKNVLGDKFLDRDHFRIGASKLANNLLSKLEGSEVSYFGERVLKNCENKEKNQDSSKEISEKSKKIQKDTKIKPEPKERKKRISKKQTNDVQKKERKSRKK